MAKLAVIGGGINGVMSAWALARAGHAVVLFERDTLIGATSRASSKLLHGGLRYLENGEFALVKQALADRAWWLANAPAALVHPLPIVLPVYRGARRARWQLKLGLLGYDALAGSHRIKRHGWLSADQLGQDGLNPDDLLGGYRYWDGQMDDARLGAWAAQQAQAAGVQLREHCPVARLSTTGELWLADGSCQRFDAVVNAAGPWAGALLDNNGIASDTRLDLVRGSHLLFAQPLACGYLLQVPGERRVVFALPYLGQTLLGTTEVRQSLAEPVACSAAERAYLLDIYRYYFPSRAAEPLASFAGVRPLLASHADPNRALREYRLEHHGRLLTVFGGKWTTAPSLAREVAARIAACL